MQKFKYVKELGISEPYFKVVTNRMFKDALVTQIRVNSKQKELEKPKKKSESDEDFYLRALQLQLDMETLVEDFLVRTFKLSNQQKKTLEDLPQDETGVLYQSTLATIQGIDIDEESDKEKSDDTKSKSDD